MRMTSDILSMGASWGSSGDVYNGGVFLRIWFFFGLCISWRNVIEIGLFSKSEPCRSIFE